MKTVRAWSSFLSAFLNSSRSRANPPTQAGAALAKPKIGLALGGGFARGVAHAGVLRAFQREGIPLYCITGVSAGAIVAAAYASGAAPEEIARAGCAMRFTDVARWSIRRMGFVVTDRMKRFLERLLKSYRFEEMQIPLGVVATDLCTGEQVAFRDSGDVFLPIQASCSYPGLFQPVKAGGRLLVDGAMSTEVPALLARQLGANYVISVHLPAQNGVKAPANLAQVIHRCFQIMQSHSEQGWRQASDLVIAPDVSGVAWDGFECGPQMVDAGDAAAMAVMPVIRSWFPRAAVSAPENSVLRSAPATASAAGLHAQPDAPPIIP